MTQGRRGPPHRLVRTLVLMLPLLSAAVPSQTPGPPPVPLGEPMARDLGTPGDPRPSMPDFASGRGGAQPAEPSPEPFGPRQDPRTRSDGEEKKPTSEAQQ